MANYTLTVTNHSAHSDNIMVFQNNPGSFSSDALALAWFSTFSNPGPNVRVDFHWTIDWGFSWSAMGTLSPGVTFLASDQVDADQTSNQITLDFDGAYQFIDQQKNDDPSRFFITEDSTLPVNSTAAVGITMAGNTVYAVQARPNNKLTFTPHPTYFLAYGSYVPGQVLDLSDINNPLELVYGPGVFNLSVTLNEDDSWGPITSLAVANAHVLAARKQNQPMLAAVR
jgi:hypothetical protein